MPEKGDLERTEDGRHVVVDGRRWRASDPALPPALRQELVDELMAARRAVRSRDEVSKTAARARVQDAKVALGERGHPWWEAPTDESMETRVVATVRALLRKRDGRSICPSDVARVVGGEGWREQMGRVREVAAGLVDAGELVVTQKGRAVGIHAAGPIRLERGPGFDAV